VRCGALRCHKDAYHSINICQAQAQAQSNLQSLIFAICEKLLFTSKCTRVAQNVGASVSVCLCH